MPREQKKKKTKEKSKSPKEKSPIESEDPKMDEDEINRLMQNALDQANATAVRYRGSSSKKIRTPNKYELVYARGAPPATAHYRAHRVFPAPGSPGDVPGAKAAPP